MFHLSFVNLPREIVHLCKLDMNSSDVKKNIENILKKNHFIKMILEEDLQTLGTQDLRNRLAGLYLEKLFTHHYGTFSYEDLLDDLKRIEDHFHRFSINGFSRLFLLGLFIRMHNIQILGEDKGVLSHFELHPKIIDLLKISKVKIERIDYLVLFLHHLIEEISFEESLKLIESKLSFNEIFNRLEVQAQRMIHHNLLSYSSSIFEPEFYIYDKV